MASGDANGVNVLLANGADVNGRTDGGQTPLILAVLFGHTNLLHLLLKAGADPLLRDKLGLNAIEWAERKGLPEAIELFTNGSSLGARSTKGTGRTSRSSEERQKRVVTSPTESLSREPVSSDEKARRWIAGVKQRFDEQAQREATAARDASRREQPSADPPAPSLVAGHDNSLEGSTKSAEILITAQPSELASDTSFESSQRTAQTIPDAVLEKPGPPAPVPDNQLTAAVAEWPVALTTQPPKTVLEEPGTPAVVLDPPVTAAVAEPAVALTTQPIPETVLEEPGTPAPVPDKPLTATVAEPPVLRTRSSRKRCPKCNTVYDSELVAYCAYHIVRLVDADEPEVVSKPVANATTTALLWIFVLITVSGAVFTGYLITTYLKGVNRDAPAVATPRIQRGLPVVGGDLVGKSRSLPEAVCQLKGSEAAPGTVTVVVMVDTTGRVYWARGYGGDFLLRNAATEAATKSTFAPEKLQGRETEGTITYTFTP